MPDEKKPLTADDLRGLREKALKPEHLKRREEVAEHTAIIAAGVKPPQSGTFGKPGPPPKAKR